MLPDLPGTQRGLQLPPANNVRIAGDGRLTSESPLCRHAHADAGHLSGGDVSDHTAAATLSAAPRSAQLPLGWLIRKGRLPAIKRGRRWFATIAAVERYRQEVESQEIPRGRPSTKA